MIVEAGRDKEVSEWLVSKGYSVTPPYVTLAIMEGGKVIAAAVYNNFQDSNIDLSVVFDHTIPLTRGNLRAVFQYPFEQAGVRRISVRTKAANLEVRKLIRRLGFKPEGKHNQFYGDDAAFSYGMLRHECKWLS